MTDNLPWQPPPRRPGKPSHDQIMHKIRCASYAAKAIREAGLWDTHPRQWTAEQRRDVAQRQAVYRRDLGLPQPSVT